MLASICDAATERLIQLAVDELGPPPAAFAFIAMGSQGRQEQTLLTDQDNGIIFAPAENADPTSVADYFLRLGARVCDGLNRAGYPLCRGKVMASNPRWCRSLPDWIAGFDEWVHKSEPQEIIDLSIFFDFRTVYGDAELTHELRRHIHAALLDQPAFFHHFAQNALTVQAALPPAGQHLLERRRHGTRRRDQSQRCHDADGQFCAAVCAAPPDQPDAHPGADRSVDRTERHPALQPGRDRRRLRFPDAAAPAEPSSPRSRPGGRRRTSSIPANWATSSRNCSNKPLPRLRRCRRRSAMIFWAVCRSSKR